MAFKPFEYSNYPAQGITTIYEDAWPVARACSLVEIPLIGVPGAVDGVPLTGMLPWEDSFLLLGQMTNLQTNGLYWLASDTSTPELIAGQVWLADNAAGDSYVQIPVNGNVVYVAQGQWTSVDNGYERCGASAVIQAQPGNFLVLRAPAIMAGTPVVGTVRDALFARTHQADEQIEFRRDRIVSVQQGNNAGRWRFRWTDGFAVGISAVFFDRLTRLPAAPASRGFTPDSPQSMDLIASPPSQKRPPGILEHPGSQAASAGQTITLSVTASGSPPFTYQWRLNGVNISGATSSTLVITNFGPANNGSYVCQVSNAWGTVASNAANVQMGNLPTIIVQPQPKTVGEFQSTYMSVSAIGTGPTMTFQWYKDGLIIPGATQSSYTIASARPSDQGLYTVVVTNPFGSVTSIPALLTVGQGLTITTQPHDLNATVGGYASLSVIAVGTGPITYQWFKNNVAIPGATLALFEIQVVASTDAGTYRARVSNPFGSVDSRNAVMTVNAGGSAPVILTSPVNRAVTVGQAASFFVTASGSAPLTYQWFHNGVAIPGAAGTSYTKTNCQMADAGSYWCTVTNPVGSATSGAATLDVTTTAQLYTVYIGNAGTTAPPTYTAAQIQNLENSAVGGNAQSVLSIAKMYEISVPLSNTSEYQVVALPVQTIDGQLSWSAGGATVPMTTVMQNLDISGMPYRVFRTGSRSVGGFTLQGNNGLVLTIH